jgi:hypothetical protein
MPLYDLSIDPGRVGEAERLVSLEGRSYPTLVMQWESELFGQTWTTTIVLDYVIALPPLMVGQGTFNDVRVAAYVGGASTKFFYFGTEMTGDVPRVAPEMENVIGPANLYQEFRLEERTCPIPYLKLIQATPRIFGNAAQDYYSPPIKVERYDGTAGAQHIADYFPAVVANLAAVKGEVLTDPARGFWTGARFLGARAIAILRQDKIVGLCRRAGKDTKEPLPSEVKKRDPKLDVTRRWVAIDVGARAMAIAIGGEKGAPELLRIGATLAPTRPSDLENPSEVSFRHVGRTVKAWRERVILPTTRWEDVTVGHAARAARVPPEPSPPKKRDSSRPPPPVTGPDPLRAAASLRELTWLRERIERGEAVRLRGVDDADSVETLKKPAPPVIDEDGIGAHDPFDPVELYAYYVGLHVNERSRGIATRYVVTMPTGWSAERRASVLVAFRRGLFRSLPAGLVPYEDLEELRVIDGGPSAVAFAVQAFRIFGVQLKGEPVPFCAIDAGASETGLIFGLLRAATAAEKEDAGHERVLEHLEPVTIPWLGGERLLHRLAWRVWSDHVAKVRELRIPIEPPVGEVVDAADAGDLVASTLEARTNAALLRDALRPVLEDDAAVRVPAIMRLLSVDGAAVSLDLTVDREALAGTVRGWLAEGAVAIRQALADALTKIGKQPDPYDGLRVLLGGRLGMSSILADAIAHELPSTAKLHRFVEPDRTNLGAPTVKTACALGALAMRFERVGAVPRAEARDAFRHRVGRARHGQLATVLEPGVDYDAWREMGACSKPDVEVLYMVADADEEVAADDPRVRRATCSLGADAVGKRTYLRAVAPTRVEVAAGPPGGDPDEDGPRWGLDLTTGVAGPVGSS